MRNRILFVIITLLFAVLVCMLVNLSGFHHGYYAELSEKNCIRLLPQIGSRGRILDTNGIVLVDNELSYDVLALPQDKKQLQAVMAKIASLLDMDVEVLRKNYKASFISSSVPVTIARNINVKKAILLEELKMELPGFMIQAHPLRTYPYGAAACHVLGYVDEIDQWRLTKLEPYGYKTRDIVGFGGVEELYDYYLRQEDGGLSMEVDRRGKFVRVVGFKPPGQGKDIQLTLDIRLQKIVEEALADTKGAVVFMDPVSGEILAMASNPSFEPAAFVRKPNPVIQDLLTNQNSPLLNRAISAQYPPGSVFKPIVGIAGLETKKTTAATVYTCLGSIHLGRQQINCWDTHDQEDLKDAVTHSCNVFFYKTGLSLGAQTMHDYALRFGLSKTTGIDLPYEVPGVIPSAPWKRKYQQKSWYEGDTVNLSIGQGYVLVTPLQMARVIAVFANKGTLVTPRIVKAIGDKRVSADAHAGTNVQISNYAMEYMRHALGDVVLNSTGTAHILGDVGIPVAGKTGTAQAAGGQPHAWFTGFFPYKNPRYAVCVMLEHGGPGTVAVGVAKQIIQRMIEGGLLEKHQS